MISGFKEFINHKEREGKRHLRIVGKLLESQGFSVKSHLDDDEPYIFMRSPGQAVSFDGIRIYRIGSQMAFRIQKREDTQPFGRAYPLNIEKMFEDMLADHKRPEQAGAEVVKAVTEEMHRFFKKTSEAEKELRGGEINSMDPLSKIVVKSTGTDYSNMITSK